MSIAVMSWALTLPLKPTPKLVLVALADNANDQGWCHPKLATIGSKASVSRSTVRRVLDQLSKLGLVSVKQRKLADGKNDSNLYKIHWQEPGRWTFGEEGVGVQNEPQGGCQNEPLPPDEAPNCAATPAESAGCQNEPQGGVNLEPMGVTAVVHEPSLNYSCSHTPGVNAFSQSQPEVEDGVFAQASMQPPGGYGRLIGTLMTADWQPNAELLRTGISSQIPSEFVEQALIAFRDYWLERGEPRCGWSTKFKARLEQEWRRHLNDERRTAQIEAGRDAQAQALATRYHQQSEQYELDRPRSIVDKLTDTSWAQGLTIGCGGDS